MKIILVGAGGIGLSAIAQILHKLGYKNLFCIDSSDSEVINKLKKQGIKTIIGHGKIEINPDDLVIYSDAAINSPEVKKAKRKFSYFEFLGHISKHFITIGIAGSHGKSTTTGMMIYTFKKFFNDKLGLGIVGAFMQNLNGKNFYLNDRYKDKIKSLFDHIIYQKFKNFDYNFIKKLYFIIEADEFNYHFLHLDTDYAIITNIDRDHTDIYKTQEDYIEVFKKFSDLVRNKIITSKTVKDKLTKLDINLKNKIIEAKFDDIQLSIPGKHNRYNANLVKFFIENIFNTKLDKDFLLEFKGLWRRLELIYTDTKKNNLIFSDYAHHPTELEACLQALRENFPNKKITLFFQPHQARRVLQFFDEFTKVFIKFDKTYIYKIYAAREDIESILNFVKQIGKWKKEFENIKNFNDIGQILSANINSKYLTSFEEVIKIINELENSIILIATAGDLDYFIRKYYYFKE